MEIDAIKAQAELLSHRWPCNSCTFENIQSASKCAKCDTPKVEKAIVPAQSAPQPKVAVRSDSPKVESSCSQTSQIIPKATHVLPSHGWF